MASQLNIIHEGFCCQMEPRQTGSAMAKITLSSTGLLPVAVVAASAVAGFAVAVAAAAEPDAVESDEAAAVVDTENGFVAAAEADELPGEIGLQDYDGRIVGLHKKMEQSSFARHSATFGQ